MNRREWLSTLSIGIGGGVLLPQLWVSCQSDDYVATFFQSKDIELINEIGEVILPTTEKSGGAKAAKVALFIDIFAEQGLALTQKEILSTGIPQFKARCKEKTGRSFLKLDGEAQQNLLVELDAESKRLTTDVAQPHYFKLLKDLILFAYFTSEVGMTEAMRYEAVPGKFIGNYPYEVGQGNWAL